MESSPSLVVPSHQREPFVCVFSGVPGTGKSTLAEAITVETNAVLLNWDWLMSALRAFPTVWDAVEDDGNLRRDVGYELMARMIESRLRLRQSSVTDCVARPRALELWTALAVQYGASVFVVECSIADPDVHRTRIVGRLRNIPAWDELDWEHVQLSREKYAPLPEPKLSIDATNTIAHNLEVVREYLRIGLSSGER